VGQTGDRSKSLRQGPGVTLFAMPARAAPSRRDATQRAGTRRNCSLPRTSTNPGPRPRWSSAYSKGNRQNVLIVAALSSRADLLILDEPTSGLKPLVEAQSPGPWAGANRDAEKHAVLDPTRRPDSPSLPRPPHRGPDDRRSQRSRRAIASATLRSLAHGACVQTKRERELRTDI